MAKLFNLLDENDAFVVEVDTGMVDRFGKPRMKMMLEKYDFSGEGERVFDINKLRYFFRKNATMSMALAAL